MTDPCHLPDKSDEPIVKAIAKAMRRYSAHRYSAGWIVWDETERWPGTSPKVTSEIKAHDLAETLNAEAVKVVGPRAERRASHSRSGERAMTPKQAADAFQTRVGEWLLACFGEEIARDKIERNHRFIEEALELVQACGCTQSEAHQLVDYVYSRPIGEIGQEVGGVMNTLAALCLAHGLDMDAEADREITRCWQKIEKIRAKQAAKPKHSPLPAVPESGDGPSEATLKSAVTFTALLAENAGGSTSEVGRHVRTAMDDLGVTPRRIEASADPRDDALRLAEEALHTIDDLSIDTQAIRVARKALAALAKIKEGGR